MNVKDDGDHKARRDTSSVAEVATLHDHPLRRLVMELMRKNGTTAEEIAKACGYADAMPIEFYLKGIMKLSITHIEQVGELLGVDLETMLRFWLRENSPELLAILDRLPAPPLLSVNERRMIEQVRSYTTSLDVDLVVADAAEVVALVMVR